jgi:uncharacterized Tic20 family protein
MTVMGNPSRRRHVLQRYPRWGGQVPSRSEEVVAMIAYVGAIVLGLILLGQVVPLVVYLSRRHASPFVRYHAAQALNVTLTFPLYAFSAALAGLLLSFDSPIAALAVMGPIGLIGWSITAIQLTRGASAADHGEFHEIPHWICSPFLR